MNKFQKDEQHLVEFLRQHKGAVPLGAPNLEEQILQAVASLPQQYFRRQQLWFVPPVIAAGLLLGWAGYRIVTPFVAPVDTVGLQAFLENNWDSVLDGTPSDTKTRSDVSFAAPEAGEAVGYEVLSDTAETK
ncbi:MAG: hypothetical protein NVS2B14_04610 [Chamaesiphon sp.]